MRDLNGSNFGIMIAYLIPGFVVLAGISQMNPAIAVWLQGSSQGELTIGGFLYVTLVSLSLGLIVSTVRWAVIDAAHHRTGIRKPRLAFANLHDRTSAFARIVEDRYRFYQFYSNTATALPVALICKASNDLTWTTFVLAVFVETVLLAGSRDSLSHYYAEMAQLLGSQRKRRSSRRNASRK